MICQLCVIKCLEEFRLWNIVKLSSIVNIDRVMTPQTHVKNKSCESNKLSFEILSNRISVLMYKSEKQEKNYLTQFPSL